MIAGAPWPPSHRKLWHIAGSKRRCWLQEKTTKCLWQEASTLPQRQQNSAFNCTRSDKSVAYVTNNKRLYSTFCTVEANYWQTLSIARPLCDSRATCMVLWFCGWVTAKQNIFIARQRYWYNNSVCPSVRPLRSGILWKRLNVLSSFLNHTVAESF